MAVNAQLATCTCACTSCITMHVYLYKLVKMHLYKHIYMYIINVVVCELHVYMYVTHCWITVLSEVAAKALQL